LTPKLRAGRCSKPLVDRQDDHLSRSGKPSLLSIRTRFAFTAGRLAS
jgi:hypothetical protein